MLRHLAQARPGAKYRRQVGDEAVREEDAGAQDKRD